MGRRGGGWVGPCGVQKGGCASSKGAAAARRDAATSTPRPAAVALGTGRCRQSRRPCPRPSSRLRPTAPPRCIHAGTWCAWGTTATRICTRPPPCATARSRSLQRRETRACAAPGTPRVRRPRPRSTARKTLPLRASAPRAPPQPDLHSAAACGAPSPACLLRPPTPAPRHQTKPRRAAPRPCRLAVCGRLPGRQRRRVGPPQHARGGALPHAPGERRLPGSCRGACAAAAPRSPAPARSTHAA